MSTPLPVLVIGAGPGGLCAAAALQARGLPFEIVDAGRRPGGIWDIDRARTPMYASAHFISSRTLSGFPDFPMPRDYPDYPRHDLIQRYIEAYAGHHGLDRRIRFRTRVTWAEPLADGGWEVVFEPSPECGAHPSGRGTNAVGDDGAGRSERGRYAALVVATGMTWHPNVPRLPGDFDGEVMHSFDYRDPSVFRGRRVVVVGAGNSGVDIACDAARSAAAAFLSVRRGYRFVPKYIFGRPADVFAHSGPTLPRWLEKRVFAFLLDRVLVGDVTRYGLPEPDHGVLESHPIMNTRVLDHMGHGDLVARPDVEALDGDGVRFVDGTRDTADLVVLATGYRRRFPFLPDAVGNGDEGPLDLHLNIFHRDRPDLAFVGLFETDGAAYGLFHLQSRLVAGALAAHLGEGGAGTGRSSPSKRDSEAPSAADRFALRRATERPDPRGGRRYLESPRHTYYVASDVYARLLERELAVMEW